MRRADRRSCSARAIRPRATLLAWSRPRSLPAARTMPRRWCSISSRCLRPIMMRWPATSRVADLAAARWKGQSIDGFRLDQAPLRRPLHTAVPRARIRPAGKRSRSSFPSPPCCPKAAHGWLLRAKCWSAARVNSPFVGGVIAVCARAADPALRRPAVLRGQTLETRLETPRSALPKGLDIATRLARAVAALHRLDIVHRDIKPDNVMLTAMAG